jgi:hypothetical protein
MTRNKQFFLWSVFAFSTCLLLLGITPFALAEDDQEDAVQLFNGENLDGWEYFLVDPELEMSDVWSVRDELLICKGQPMGYLATEKEYTNFRIVVQWRWAPDAEPTNSGILMRITGEPQALPKCAEAQLKHGSVGDIYGFHGFQVGGDEDRAISAENPFVGKLSGMTKIKDNENEPGEWNTYDITVEDGDITILLNGEKVNEATDCEVIVGKIALQSEGGEIHFRKVQLFPLDEEDAEN